jgi:hypothetical protein
MPSAARLLSVDSLKASRRRSAAPTAARTIASKSPSVESSRIRAPSPVSVISIQPCDRSRLAGKKRSLSFFSPCHARARSVRPNPVA